LSSANPQSPDPESGAGRGWFHEQLILWIAFGIAAITLGYGLGRAPLMWPDEGRNAEVAREMKEGGRWLVPTYNGATYLDKPAFYFKSVALSLRAFGDTELAARLPSAVSGLLLLAITCAFARHVAGRRCAAIAVMVVATTPLFVAYSRIVIFDIQLTLFTCVAIFAGFLAEESDGFRRRNWYLLSAFAAGLGTLVKGPVGFLVPALVLLIFNRVDGRTGSVRRLLSPLNLVVFLGTVLPWFIGVSLAHPDFPRYGIVEESFRRFTTGSFQRSKPFHYYPLIVVATFFPWSLLLPGSIVSAWKRRTRWSRLDRLCIVWTIVVLLFFSFSNSKMPGYILSVTVSLGLLIARLFDRALGAAETELKKIPIQGAALLAAVCTAGAILAIYLILHPVELERRLRLDAGEAGLMRTLLAPLAATLFLVGAVSMVALIRRNVGISLAALVGFPTVAMLLNLGMLEFVAARRSARPLAARLAELVSTRNLVCLECLPHGLPFYLGRTIPVFTRDGGELSSNYVLFNLKATTTWPSTLIPLSDRDAWLDRRSDPLVVIARTRSRPVLEQIAAERGGQVVRLTRHYCALLLPARRPA